MEKKSADAELKRIPKMTEIYCPITLSLFEEPMIASDGSTYEKKAIKKWLKTKKTSPLTNEPISTCLISNLTMKKAVAEYKEKIRPYMKETKSELTQAKLKLKRMKEKIEKLKSTLKTTEEKLQLTTAQLEEARQSKRHFKRMGDHNRFFKEVQKNNSTDSHSRRIRRQPY